VYDETNPDPPTLDTKFHPHWVVDAWWILRVSRRVDLKFAPLIVYPSQYIFGGELHRSGNKPFDHVGFFTMGASVRF
jgi:hypothetical protein